MSVVGSVVEQILDLHGGTAYALVGGLAFAEAGLLVGFVLPGETAVILGGVLAAQHGVSLPFMLGVTIMAAVLGDSAGYEMGRRVGPRLLRGRLYARHRTAFERGFAMLNRHGGKAVLIGRFTSFLRAVMPGMAGMAGMPYRRFLTWNALGGVVWAAGYTLLGYAAGNSYSAVELWAGRGGVAVLVAVVLLAAGVLLRREVRSRRDA